MSTQGGTRRGSGPTARQAARTREDIAHVQAQVALRHARASEIAAHNAAVDASRALRASQSAYLSAQEAAHAELTAQARATLDAKRPRLAATLATLQARHSALVAQIHDAYVSHAPKTHTQLVKERAKLDPKIAAAERQLGYHTIHITDQAVGEHARVRAARADEDAARARHFEANTRSMQATTETRRQEGVLQAAAVAADVSHGGAGVLVKYAADDARASARAVFGHLPSTQTLIALTGARRGDDIRLRFRGNGPYYQSSIDIHASSRSDDAHATFTLARLNAAGAARTQLPIGALIASGPDIRSGSKTTSTGQALINGIRAMARLGVAQVELTAQGNARSARTAHGYNGYTTWAKLGARGALPPSVRESAARAFGPGVTSVEQVMALPGGRAWWKEHGDTFQAELDLRPGSVTRQRIDALAAALAKRE